MVVTLSWTSSWTTTLAGELRGVVGRNRFPCRYPLGCRCAAECTGWFQTTPKMTMPLQGAQQHWHEMCALCLAAKVLLVCCCSSCRRSFDISSPEAMTYHSYCDAMVTGAGGEGEADAKACKQYMTSSCFGCFVGFTARRRK